MQWVWAIDGWIVLVGILSACSCALVGSYLVLRRMSLMGDAISHAVLPGLALAFILSGSRASGPMFLGAVVVGVLTALLTQAITRYGKVEQGAAMGVVFSVLFAVGLVLIRRAADHVDLDPGCVLYGSIEQIPLDAVGGGIPSAVVNLACVLVANVLFVSLFYKELKICAFDPSLASTLGIDASVMHYALMVMVAVTTVANFESAGSILVIAMLIVPGAAAHLLTDRLGIMLLLSVAIGATSAVVGHILATFGPTWIGIDASANTAAMMATVAGAMLFGAILFSPQHGLVARTYLRLALSLQIARQDILGLLYRWQELHPRGAKAMRRVELVTAIGDTIRSRRALRSLVNRRQIRRETLEDGGEGISLTPDGVVQASRLVGSHRLWESYLAKNFEISADRLHMPAERMEHYITPTLRDELREHLTDPTHDPHGRAIPDADDR